MSNPFPGMNPWLERPALWSDVHFRLISALARYLQPLVRPRYYVSVGAQTYITSAPTSKAMTRNPDVAIVESHSAAVAPVQAAVMQATIEPIMVQVPTPDYVEQAFLEVREAETDEVITVIEVLSPTNKRPGAGRRKYERKRLEILSTFTNLVEIDLLRAWKPMPTIGDAPASHYRILVRRGEAGNEAELYPFNLQDPIPSVPLPLQSEDAEPLIPLKDLLDKVYLEGDYDVRLNYKQPPIPPLQEADMAWARAILA